LQEMFEVQTTGRSHLDLENDLERDNAFAVPWFNATREPFGHVPAI